MVGAVLAASRLRRRTVAAAAAAVMAAFAVYVAVWFNFILVAKLPEPKLGQWQTIQTCLTYTRVHDLVSVSAQTPGHKRYIFS